ncbi:MAG: DciA family protein [Candidatus Micrarchaeia archaeon]
MADIERIDVIIKRIMEGIKEKVDTTRCSDISAVWTKLIDDPLKGKCYVFKEDKEKKILYVKVESSVCLSMLRLQKSQIKKKLKEIGFTYTDIRFLV